MAEKYEELRKRIESEKNVFELDRLRRVAVNEGFLSLAGLAASRLFSCGVDLLGQERGVLPGSPSL